MAGIISISSKDDDIWMVQNHVFDEFLTAVCILYASDEKLVFLLEGANAIHGLSFDLMKDHDEAVRVWMAVRTTAKQVSEGALVLPLAATKPASEFAEHKDIFAKLVRLLDRWDENASYR